MDHSHDHDHMNHDHGHGHHGHHNHEFVPSNLPKISLPEGSQNGLGLLEKGRRGLCLEATPLGRILPGNGGANVGSRIRMTENDLYESTKLLSSDTMNLLGSKMIERERITLKNQVGQGNFGRVFRGEE